MTMRLLLGLAIAFVVNFETPTNRTDPSWTRRAMAPMCRAG
jgi:hypothetical protein